MKVMKWISIVTIFLLFSCSAETGKVGNINTEDITYFKDKKTNICYAIIGARQGDSWDQSTSIGMACVPCEKVQKYLINK